MQPVIKFTVVAAAALLSLAASQAWAQQPASAAAPAATAPPPAWQQGRGADQAASTLAPVPGKLTVTPASQIPVSRLKLPDGFKLEIWATGMPGARAMTRGDGGKIYVGTRGIGRVYELSDSGDNNNNSNTRTSRIVVDKLNQPAGVVMTKDGALIVMAIDKVLRFDDIEKNPQVAPVDMTAAFQLPPEQHHAWKYLRFGPDGSVSV